MKRLISTINLPKEVWLKYRKTGITGTDAGAICGMNPYRSAFQVYQDKLSEDVEEFDNEATRQGKDFEEYVAFRFCEETGFKVHRANAIYYNEEHPLMLADFDRIISGQKAGLECKTVSPYSQDKWADGKIPLQYLLQVQHYLAVSGFDCWYIAALILGRELIIRKVERDEELINNLITVEENYWNTYVIPHVMPDPDGSDSCSAKIREMYYRSDKDLPPVDLAEYDDALKRREEILELIDKLDKEKNAIDQKIQLELGDAAYGVGTTYRVSWLSSDTKRLDVKKLKADKPDIFDAYCKSSSVRRFIVKPAA